MRPRVTETTALGAAYLAGLAVGYWQSKTDIAQQWQQDRRFAPQMKPATRRTLVAGWDKALNRAKDWEIERPKVDIRPHFRHHRHRFNLNTKKNMSDETIYEDMLPVGGGETVPEFKMETFEPSTGQFGEVSLPTPKADGKWTILVFYLADFTFVCPTELADLAGCGCQAHRARCQGDQGFHRHQVQPPHLVQ